MKHRAGCLAFGLLLLLAPSAHACVNWAASRYAVPVELLQAIAQVESSANPRAFNRNVDGTHDIGLMQINSIHLPRLLKQGITEQRLLDEPCLSVEVGASILADFIKQFGYNWTAVGAYNVGPGAGGERDALRLRYAQKIWARYEELMQHRNG